jgi:hypothetical protein
MYDEAMLYLLGGAARSGKSIIANRLVKERQTPYFCIDYLVTAFARGAPDVGIEHEQPNIIRARNIWPKLKPMLENILDAEPNYLIEGDALLPEYAQELLAEHKKSVRVCFLGYPRISTQKKLNDMQKFPGAINDWTKDQSPEDLRKLVEEMIEFSKYLETECRRFHIQFFDVSEQFTDNLQNAFQYLEQGGVARHGG